MTSPSDSCRAIYLQAASDDSFVHVRFISTPGQKRNCEPWEAEKFSALSHVLSQPTTRRYAAGFRGKAVKTDSPTGVDWNDAMANERERVGVKISLVMGV